MRYPLFFLALLFSCVVAYGQPKAVKGAYSSLAGIVTYKNGLLKADGTALIVGSNGDVMASSKLFVGADSAVVIDNNGKAYAVEYLVSFQHGPQDYPFLIYADYSGLSRNILKVVCYLFCIKTNGL